jgi:hypothetical protein
MSDKNIIELYSGYVGGIGKYSGKWFFLELSPVPTKNIELITTQIYNNIPVEIDDAFKLVCNENRSKGTKKLPLHIKKLIKNLSQEIYLVAIRAPNILPSEKNLYDTEIPISIILSPTIDFESFPEHPHLYYNDISSICYTANWHDITQDPRQRVAEAFEDVLLWLYRHIIWRDTSRTVKDWIGKQSKHYPDFHYLKHLNPELSCRCGSGKKYKDCHLKEHYIAKYNSTFTIEAYTSVVKNYNSRKTSENSLKSVLHAKYIELSS